MTDKNLTFTRRRYTGHGKYVIETVAVTYPESGRVKFDTGQHTVVIANGVGEVFAAFVGVTDLINGTIQISTTVSEDT